MPGPHVFGDDRRGLWVAESSNLTDKLTHMLPRLRGAIPNLTDVFLPPTATSTNRQQVRNNNFFCHMWAANHARSAVSLADYAVQRHGSIGAGALELNIEGLPESVLEQYIRDAIARVRSKRPNLPLRINVVPWKGQWLPHELFVNDPQLFVIAQTYGGNMEFLYAADEVLADLVDWGIPRGKASVMHAVMCEGPQDVPRQVVIPEVRNKGSFYIDDLLMDATLID